MSENTPQMSKAEKLVEELKEDLPRLFDLSYTPKWSLYDSKVKFVDPLNQFDGVSKYQSNIQMLKDSPLFGDSKMDLHTAVVQPDGSVLTRWTLSMTFKAFPWKPRLLFTGTSEYYINDAGLVEKHVDKWDSINEQAPFSSEALQVLIGQLLPDVTKAGVQMLKGGAQEELTYAVLRKTKDIEIRRFDPFDIVETEEEGVYSRETYDDAIEKLRNYRGDALVKPQNKAGKLLPATDPLLQMDAGTGLTSLAYVNSNKRGRAPGSLDKTLTVKPWGKCLVAVKSVRGFGADRTRSEQSVQDAVNALRAAIQTEGYAATEGKDAFILASYADGYELWIRVEETQAALRVRTDR